MKHALITGASGGIGSSAAIRLSREGYSLYLHYCRNAKKADELKEKLEAEGIRCRTIQSDLSAPDGPDRLLNQIEDPIDLVVLSSGTAPYGLITDLSDQEAAAQIQLHVTSPFLLVKKLTPGMVARKAGNIVFITSIWGETGASCEVLYSMAKGGQNLFVKALAKELAPSGIRVNAVSPGAVSTDMLASFTTEELSALQEEIPAGRIGKPEEVAEAVAFLASEKASYITGHILSVNGGWN
ncbi:SDR family oxidoreductase [Bacillus mangrovi]|uniref:SDR family oxidoreductase n=1 Tax=Metabacillus mangrovi TaxID=1491830 RepID=A0A7X2S0K1_9BACI|nr:SDR family oxidoreductase [Metabacillus mangrovi]MTH51782.1 SDR family oxidoreductase [Metabacillus mangrovi]